MAVFYKHLKGMNDGMQSTTAVNYYTFINFTNDKITAPSISLNTDQFDVEATTRNDLGNIIVSKPVSAASQIIKGPLVSTKLTSSSTDLLYYVAVSENSNQLTETDGTRKIMLSVSLDNEATAGDVGDSILKTNCHLGTTKKLGCTSLVVGDSIENLKSSTINDGAIRANEINAKMACNAGYFNATSDRRAKTDILPLTCNAIQIIKDVPVYSFKYKDLNTPSIGIIAQDVQKYLLGDFKLVENESATGNNLDYMSIHESKLVYILWKAVQELTEEINQLKQQL